MENMPYSSNWKESIQQFIKQSIESSGAEGVILGLSGGLDSAVVAKLSAMAIGKENVTAYIMPDSSYLGKDMKDALSLAEGLGIDYKMLNIEDVIKDLLELIGDADPYYVGNLKSRTRMTILYHFANMNNLIVMGTGNKSELLSGYFTKYGDGGADYLPIGDLYKTQVRKLAADIEIPEEIIQKPPTAGLWLEQTDEMELGITYDDLDKILFGLEKKLPLEEIASGTGISIDEVNRIASMVKKSAHKLRPAPICRIGDGVIGIDWHL